MGTKLNLGQISGLTESLENLNTEINNEESRIDNILSGTTSDLDSFAELVSMIQDIDSENDSQLSIAIMNSALNSGDTYVTGGTFDSTNGSISFTNNLGSSFTITGVTMSSSDGYKYIKSNSISFLEANVNVAIRTFLLNEIIFYPIHVKQSLDITHAQLQVTSTAGATSRTIVGIYDNSNGGLPTNLLGSTIINTTTNSVFSTSFSTPISLTPGIYWVATNTNISFSCYCLRGSTLAAMQNTFVNVVSSDNGGGLNIYERYRLTYTYNGSLPSTITSPLTLTVSDYANPYITFKIDY